MRYIERTQWPEPGEPIPADEVHLYLLHAERPWQSNFAALLNDEELIRARRYALDAPRKQFIQVRGSLRLLLGRYLTRDPRSIEFVLRDVGKPALPKNELHFNVAHSGNVGVIAVGHRLVGVDVEILREMPNAEGLVNRFFADVERKQFASLPDDLKVPAFFRGWTAKEALLKAVGVGLADLDDCVVDLDPRLPPRIERFKHGTNWQLDQRERDGTVICTAIEC